MAYDNVHYTLTLALVQPHSDNMLCDARRKSVGVSRQKNVVRPACKVPRIMSPRDTVTRARDAVAPVLYLETERRTCWLDVKCVTTQIAPAILLSRLS